MVLAARDNTSVPARLTGGRAVQVIPVRIVVSSISRLSNSFPIASLCSCCRQAGGTPSAATAGPGRCATFFRGVHSRRPRDDVIRVNCASGTSSSFRDTILTTRSFRGVCLVSTLGMSNNLTTVILCTTSLLRGRPSVTIRGLITTVRTMIPHARFSFVPSNLRFLETNNHISGATCLNTSLLGVGPAVRLVSNGLISAGGCHNGVDHIIISFFSSCLGTCTVSSGGLCLVRSLNLSRRVVARVRGCTGRGNFQSIA